MAPLSFDGLQLQLQDLRARHGLTQRLLLVLLHCVLASVWLHALAKRCAPGWSRLAVAAPVVLMNMGVPLLIDPVAEVCTAAAVAFELMWLSTFKARRPSQLCGQLQHVLVLRVAYIVCTYLRWTVCFVCITSTSEGDETAP